MSLNVPKTDRKRVVIVGGGFGGIKIAEKLKGSDFQIVLIDKNNYHQFPPLLYQVATAGLGSSSISFPFRKLFQKQEHFHFRLAEVTAVRPEENRIATSLGELAYDYLVLASGTTTNYFGNQHIIQNALPMKTVEEALVLRNKLLSNFEMAVTETDPDRKQALLNIVIVGAGATGVEVAGALAEMKRFIIPKDYHDFRGVKVNIYLVEGSGKVLGVMSESASANAEKFLRNMGVIVRCNLKVVDYIDGKVCFDNGESIPTETLVWVSGVTATRFGSIDGELLGRGGRILVNAYNQMEKYPDIFAIGDVCLQTEAAYPNGHPQVAQAAIQQGNLLAGNLKCLAAGQPMKPFRYKNLGTMATVGRNKAVADLNTFKMQGFMAWMVWLLIHLRSILGVHNKLMVLFNWVWNYFTYDQWMRFIIHIPKENTSGSAK